MVASLIAFLTRIPLKPKRVEDAARYLYMFPLVGILVSLIVYTVAFFSFMILPLDIASIVTTAAIYLVTGLIHLDGLADFADGVMTSGDKEHKITVMKDPKIGIAGVFSVILSLILTFYSIRLLGVVGGSALTGYGSATTKFAYAIIVSEISAKLGMNTCIARGKNMPEGMGFVFIKHSTRIKYIIALAISVVVSFLLTGLYFVLVFSGVITALFVVRLAHRNFGGVNGDVMGAVNEIARVITLLLWAALP